MMKDAWFTVTDENECEHLVMSKLKTFVDT